MKNKFFVLAIIFSAPYKSLFLACKAVSMVYKQGENYRGYLKEGGNSGHWGEGECRAKNPPFPIIAHCRFTIMLSCISEGQLR